MSVYRGYLESFTTRNQDESTMARHAEVLVVAGPAHSLSVASENGMTTLTSALVGQITTQVDVEVDKANYVVGNIDIADA